MDTASQIRDAVERVRSLRQADGAQAALGEAVARVKRVQAQRFAGTYADLLQGDRYAAAARFFLEELYSDKDYSARDAQFARIAGAIERLFPADVAQTAVSLAQLHALTEELDSAVGRAWLESSIDGSEALRYATAWRSVGRRTDRTAQLSVVLSIGEEMIRLTRMRGLRTMLKMMRSPAAAAGLGSLQRFLEAGFDTFAELARTSAAQEFLATVAKRESALLELLFDAPLAACERELGAVLAAGR
jgi:hypothetical protein